GLDDLKLESLVRNRLLNESVAAARGDSPPLSGVYVDSSDDLGGAILPAGQYVAAGSKVTVTLRLVRDGQRVGTVTVEGTKADLPGLAAKITQQLQQAVGKL